MKTQFFLSAITIPDRMCLLSKFNLFLDFKRNKSKIKENKNARNLLYRNRRIDNLNYNKDKTTQTLKILEVYT